MYQNDSTLKANPKHANPATTSSTNSVVIQVMTRLECLRGSTTSRPNPVNVKIAWQANQQKLKWDKAAVNMPLPLELVHIDLAMHFTTKIEFTCLLVAVDDALSFTYVKLLQTKSDAL